MVAVLDIGSLGGPRAEWRRRGFHVFGVDPMGDGLNVVLDADRGQRTFYVTRKPENSSLLRPNRVFLMRFPDVARFDIVEERAVHVSTLDALAKDSDLIKLDTQGSELAILTGGAATLVHAVAVEVEVAFAQIYEAQPLFGDVDDFLRAHSFELIGFPSMYYWKPGPGWRAGQLVFAEAVYFRTFATLASMPVAKRHAALEIGTVYGYAPAAHRHVLPQFPGRGRLARLLYSAYRMLRPELGGWAYREP